MRLLFEVAKRSYRRVASYRGATVARIFTNTVFGFINAYVLLAVFRNRPNIDGLDAREAVTFVFVAQAFLIVVGAFSVLDIATRIRTGDVVDDFTRPVDMQAWWLAMDLGRAAYQTLFRSLPPLLIGAIAFDLVLPRSPAQWLAFLAAMVLAVILSFAWRFIVSFAAFWLIDERGAVQLSTMAALFFSGFAVPLQLFPDGLETLARALPFAAYVQVPIEVFINERTGGELAGAFAQQLAWIAVLIGAGRLVMAAATRKVVIHGG